MKVYLLVFFTFISSSLFAQNDSISAENEFKDWHKDYIFSIDINTFIPVGDLRSSLKESSGFGFYFGLPVNKKLRIDLGVSLYFPKLTRNVTYFDGDEILEGGASMSGTLGLWLTHVKPLGKNFSWEKRLGLGVGTFSTDIETGKPEEENDRFHSIETLSLSLGTTIRARLFHRNIGLKLDYFYVPYNLFKKRLTSNFGNQYVTIGLSFGI